jgi:hypothetical protein
MTLGSYQPANYFGGDILGAIRSAGGSGPNVVSVQPQVPTNIGGSIIASGQTPPIIGNTRPMSVASPAMTAAPAKADPLAAAREYDAMIAKRNEAARAAVLGRLRQQQQQQEQANRPTVTTEGGIRQIAGRYGKGSITPKRTGPAMIEGKPAAQWFQETEARQRRASKEYADTEKSKEEIRKKRLPNV